MKPTKLDRGKGIKLLVFGVPGAGKTRFLSTAKKTLIIRPPTDSTHAIQETGNVEEIVVRDWQDMWETFEFIQHGGYEKYDWIWLDSISLFQDFGMDDVFQNAVDKKPSRAEHGWDKGEYGINFGRIGKWIRDMSGLCDTGAFNFGITAHPFEWYNPVIEEDVWMPFIQGKNMAPKICGYMTIVAYLAEVKRKDKPSQRILYSAADGFFGKDEFDCFPKLSSGKHGIIEPTMPKLMKLIKDSTGSTSGTKTKTTTRRPARKRPAKK